jgi:hypothetical protein
MKRAGSGSKRHGSGTLVVRVHIVFSQSKNMVSFAVFYQWAFFLLQDLTHATEVHPSYLENSQLPDPGLHIQERTGEAPLLPFGDPQGPAGKEDAVLFPDTSLRVPERSGEAVLLNGLQVPEGKEAGLLFPDTGLRMQEEVVLLSDEVSLENQEMEAEAVPLGDETELVKSLAELDSHMEQVNISQPRKPKL